MSGNYTARDAAALFDGSRLTLARQLAGLRKNELARIVDVTATAVAAWESGRSKPNPGNVANLSLGLGVDPGFFVARPVDQAAGTTTPHFRSLRSTSQMMRDQAHSYGQVAVEVAAALEVHAELPEIDVPRYPVSVEDPIEAVDEAARHARKAWNMAPGRAPHLIRLLENHGVLVVFSPSASASLDAFSFDSTVRPVVILNPIKRDFYRQRFDVAHELGHLVMHADADPGSKIVEDQAHRFASEFLLPATDIEPELPKGLNKGTWVRLSQLKEQWGVSMASLLYRAKVLGTLSDSSYRNAMVTMTQRGWRRAEPGLIASIEQPSLLPATVELLSSAGIDVDDIQTQCRVPVRLFETITSRAPGPIQEVADPSEAAAGNRNITSLLRF
ncbi:XRE family transcriptional regulator [Nocardioides humi]|uniref:XRE family transcriptional regulator n=1 Tax=Nocardioides humi TaxID=449461 RepID=A0ABN2B0S9_9ACTN|nr:XRE family transcriptional regulator [Nocardioides humi]